MTISGSTKRLTERLLLALLLLTPASVRADWPFARGGTDSSGATEVSLSDELNLLWTYKAQGSSFEATPVIAGGVVYAGDADGTMHAVRLADGSKVWSRKLRETFLLSPPALDGESVFVPDADGTVHCLAIADGIERWAFDAGSEMYGGPVVYNGFLLVPTEAGVLFGVDAESGEERWTFQIEAPLRCTPTVVGGVTLLAGCDGKLHTVDVSTGEGVGICDLGDPTGNTAAVLGKTAYFGTEGGTFYAVDASDSAEPTVKWTYRDGRRGQGIRTASAVTESAVVYASQAKTIYALDPRGADEPLWTARTRANVEASPIALADGRVLVLTTRGRVLLLDATTGDEVWTYEAGGEFLASPAASGGRVVVANTDGSLICLGEE